MDIISDIFSRDGYDLIICKQEDDLKEKKKD